MESPFRDMKIKNFFILIMLTFLTNGLYAQLYNSLTGVRLGAPLSLSYKKIIKKNNAIEAYLGTRGKNGYRFVNISGVYQIIEPIDFWNVEELYFYYGGGASVYFWSFEEEGPNQKVTPGLEGYLGLEYTFSNIPLNLTIDWRPTVFLSGQLSGFKGGYLAIGVRYVLNRNIEGGNLNEE